MSAVSFDLLGRDTRSYWVKLRTLILLRWLAITGQVAAIITAMVFFDLVLPMGLCALVIGAAVIANMTASFVFPENKRLTEAEAMTMLLFDVSQLALLLGLTGGLHGRACNPASATYLHRSAGFGDGLRSIASMHPSRS